MAAASPSESPLDAVFWTWKDDPRLRDLAAAVDEAVQRNKGRATQVAFETVFTSKGHPFDSLRPRLIGLHERVTAPAAEMLRLNDPDGRWVIAAFPTPYPGVFHLVSGLPATHARWKRVERWVTAARDVSRCYLNHRDFTSIGDRLTEFGDVEVVKITARVVKDGSSINRGFPVRETGLRPSHREAIAEVEELGATVRTLALNLRDVMRLHVRRIAGATFYSGDFRLFEGQVLTRLEEATAARRDLMTGRQRQGRGPVRPVSVYLAEPIMRTAADTAEILALVQDMSDVSMAVFHRNPYLHLSITDEADGSNFDLTVTRPDSIEIFPGYRASATALARVAQRLGERFGALTIADAQPAPRVSIHDLVGVEE